ncbi:ribbon-helix-helix protein, CopG family [Pseudanabaena sp. UWO311]|uniref:ribbon-helix-helix protein, CopG family n=1 Tax=Pseudanabaena sp. UWO311 TaxID=2487337 RepID=UPI001159BD89|nr:ribbon-helix-helix protein, CopG family [Pseudanabaena sp. UWO311]TYQ29112.1 ribbon-helix-helix protein, CopG family [Pseudanabaena sp. UWO311]
MQEAITINLPVDVKASLELRSKIEAISSTELIERAVREYLLVRQFRSLRKKMLNKADLQGDFTDEDIFEMVS